MAVDKEAAPHLAPIERLAGERSPPPARRPGRSLAVAQATR